MISTNSSGIVATSLGEVENVTNGIQVAQGETAQTAAQKQVLTRVSGLLMEGENILAVAGQTDWARWFVFPSNGVVVTNHRLFLVKNGLFSFNFADMHWEHIQDVHLGMKMAGATITAKAAISKSGYQTQVIAQGYVQRAIDGLDKTQAQGVYRIGQSMENEWRERNRQRVMEERQVERGAYVVQQQAHQQQPGQQQAAAQNAHAQAASPQPDVAQRIQQLQTLLDQGLINQQEFDQRRGEILTSI